MQLTSAIPKRARSKRPLVFPLPGCEFQFTRISGLYLGSRVSSRESLFRFSRFVRGSGGACAEINIAYFCTDAPHSLNAAHIGLRYKPRQAFHPQTHNVTPRFG